MDQRRAALQTQLRGLERWGERERERERERKTLLMSIKYLNMTYKQYSSTQTGRS